MDYELNKRNARAELYASVKYPKGVVGYLNANQTIKVGDAFTKAVKYKYRSYKELCENPAPPEVESEKDCHLTITSIEAYGKNFDDFIGFIGCYVGLEGIGTIDNQTSLFME